MEDYNPPEVTEYGAVEEITRTTGEDKVGEETDEFSESTPLDGSVGFVE